MFRVLCSLALAVAALGLAPALAAADALVSLDESIGILTVTADGDPDRIQITQNNISHIVQRDNGGLTPGGDCTGGGGAVVCPRAAMIAVDLAAGDDAFSSVAVTVPESIAGGDGDDVITGAGAGDVLAGGDGDDTLDGGAGVDDVFGEDDDDTINARDGNPERIACGGGTDNVQNDFTDILAECERGIDGDGDGFALPGTDCNDANAAIRPGAAEIFGNGVDEDCNGRDDVNRDADGDGFAVPLDCDDANAAIRPGALEVRGNAVDENCDRSADPWVVVAAR